MTYQAVLVTGAPATGKSTLLKELRRQISNVHTVEFGQLIAARLAARGQKLSHSELRTQSAQVVSPQDVAELDEAVVDDIALELQHRHVVIASRAVTHEQYGNRVTAFSDRTLRRLPLSAIVVLQVPAAELLARIEVDDKGRKWRTIDQAIRLQNLQTSLALTYAVFCGCPVYIIDGSAPAIEVAGHVVAALQGDGILRESGETF